MNDAANPASAPPTPVVACDWPVTNCYIDAWTLVLRNWGMDAMAGLGVTVALDYEGDQFTFFKYLHEDLETLYGIVVGELSIWHALEDQVATQIRLGRMALVEVDGFYLPDTRATSYRMQHTKTTIGIDQMDAAAGQLSYLHNSGRFELSGEDYAGVFRKLPAQQKIDDALPPYVELVRRRWKPLEGAALTDAALAILRRHLRRRADTNLVTAYRADFPARMTWLIANNHRFHEYAFATFRQLGSNFQLLSAHLNWLGARGVDGLTPAAEAAAAISSDAKAMQFKVARIARSGRYDACEAMFEAMERSYDTVIATLERRFS
jgi:Domain of unknown function (DUF1839)